MKNVNDVDFDDNVNHDMCMKVMLLFIDIKLRIIDKYIYQSIDILAHPSTYTLTYSYADTSTSSCT